MAGNFTRNAEIVIDALPLILGQDYPITKQISIHQPRISEILGYGERQYFESLIGILTAIPADIKSILFDQGIDYEEISDFRLFCLLSKGLPPEKTRILFGDAIDFSRCIFESRKGVEVLFDPVTQSQIDMFSHAKVAAVLCKMHNISKVGKRHIAGTALTKKMLIEVDRQDREMAAKKPFQSFMNPIISSMVNSSGFKYGHKEVLDITLYQLLDSVSRIQIITSTQALTQGSYSGFCDTSKIDKKHFNWLRDTSE